MSPIKKRGKLYYIDIYAPDGSRIRKSLHTDNYFVAIDKARIIERENAQPGGPAVTFEEFKKKYLAWAWSSKPASADREQQRLRKISAFLSGLGIIRLVEITPYHIEQLRGQLRDKELEKSTINRYLQLMRGMFYRAIDWGDYAGPNPLRKVKFYKEQPEIRPLTAEQVGQVLELAIAISKVGKSPLQRAFANLVILALNTGLRKSELLNLQWKDICKDGHEIVVCGKRDKRRTVPLNDAARATIAKQPRGADFIFDIPNRNQAGLFRRTIYQIKKRTGIDWHFHLLRHAFATKLLESGVDIVTISEILGHSRAMVSLIYSHSDPQRKQQAVEFANWTGVTKI